MSETRLQTTYESLLGEQGIAAVAAALESTGQAVVLCPSFAQALMVQRELEAAGTSFGVVCTTPRAWCELRWALYGDGRSIVSSGVRRVLMCRMLEGDVEPLDTGQGSVDVLCRLASKALPWLAELSQASTTLTWGEARAVEVCLGYANELHVAHMVEPVEALCGLPRRMADAGAVLGTFVFVGFDSFDYATQRFYAELVERAEVVLIERAGWGKASERATEINELLAGLFMPRTESLEPSGAVSLIEPAGPVAEASAIAAYIGERAASGATNVCVVSRTPEDAWHTLAPKLYEQGISVRAQLSFSLQNSVVAAGFMRYAQAVAHLKDLADIWPAKPSAELPSMDWWPPRDIVDFLVSGVAGVAPKRAWALDSEWRGNRILTPGEVLTTLTEKPKQTSKALCSATKEILKGHLAAAAGYLFRALDEGAVEPSGDQDAASQNDDESAEAAEAAVLDAASALSALQARDSLAALAEVGRSLKACGIELGTDGMTLERLVAYGQTVFSAMSIPRRLELAAPGATCTVTILSPSQAALLPAHSADTVVFCGQDSQTSAIAPASGALVNLLAHLDIEQPIEPLEAARLEFALAVNAARANIAFSKALFDAAGEKTYPSAMLSEVLANYSFINVKGKAVSRLVADAATHVDEGLVEENIGATGSFPESKGVPARACAGQLADGLRRFVIVPRDGVAADTAPVLSASQIESYLECPYKWFTLRRLKLENSDAGFSNLEMGSFAHRVLEVVHRRLMFEAAVAESLIAPELLEDPRDAKLPEGELFWFDPKLRLEASRVTPANLAHAQDLLREEFALHLAHQATEGDRKAKQALIPHTESERRRLDDLQNDLLGLLEYEADKFVGFEPRLFEGSFGKGGLQATYAGVELTGTIDRIDVNEQGQAIVIDYKHKSKLFGEYALSGASKDMDADFALSNRVQTLIYAQVARRLLEPLGIEVIGALYLGTRPAYQISGAMSLSCANTVYPFGEASEAWFERVTVPVPGAGSFYELLDRTEEQIELALNRLRAGMIEANPLSLKACDYCPVTQCEKRGGSHDELDD